MQLSRAERHLAGMLVDQIIPEGSSPVIPLSAQQAGVITNFERHLNIMPLRSRLAIRSAIVLLGAYAVIGRKPAATRRALERLAASRSYALREAVILIKSLVAMAYCENPMVRAQLGLDLPPVAS